MAPLELTIDSSTLAVVAMSPINYLVIVSSLLQIVGCNGKFLGNETGKEMCYEQFLLPSLKVRQHKFYKKSMGSLSLRFHPRALKELQQRREVFSLQSVRVYSFLTL